MMTLTESAPCEVDALCRALLSAEWTLRINNQPFRGFASGDTQSPPVSEPSKAIADLLAKLTRDDS